VDHSGHEFVRKEESGKKHDLTLFSLYSKGKRRKNYIEFGKLIPKDRNFN